MENSLEEAETQQSFTSPPRRRRSTFFERRDSVVAQKADNEEVNACDIANNAVSDDRSQLMTSYYNKLLIEKDLWKREVNERRHKYHELRQQYQIAIKAPSVPQMSYAALTNEDIEFLKAKPNLSKLVESQEKFHKSIKQTVALVRRYNELEDVAIQFCKDRVNTITEYILENSTVDSK